MSVATEQDQVVHELRSAEKLLLTTHENPDGDALGSLLAMHGILTQLGKDSLMYMSPDEFPLPWEYRGFQFDGLVGAPPEDVAERTIVFLDCGNIDRMPVDFLQAEGLHILNIDHHHDNTRFGTVNLVCSVASCTAEMVWRISKELGAEITPEIAKALYVGLVTDTGRFMYENTTAAAHRMAAELIEAGVHPHVVYRELYEDLPFRRLQLLQRALASIERHDDGALTIAHLQRATTRPQARWRPIRRAWWTTCARWREPGWPHSCASSSRTTGTGCARSACAPRTAPWTCPGSPASSAAAGTRRPRVSRPRCRTPSWSRSCAVTCATSSRPPRTFMDGVLLRAKPAGVTSHDVVAEVRRSLPRGTKVGHAGTLDPFATGLLLVLVGRATRAQRFLMALPKTYRAVARLGWTSDTGDRDGELVAHGTCARAALDPDGRAAPNAAGVLGGEGGRQARV